MSWIQVDEGSSAYQAGRITGQLFMVVLVLAILWRLIQWLRSR